MGSAQRNLFIALAVVAVISGGSYLYIRGQLSDAVDNLTVELSDLTVEDLSLFPPEVNLTLTYEVRNTSGMDFDVSIDGRLYYGETLLTPLIVDEQHVEAMGSSPVEVDVTLSGSMLQALGGYSDEAEYRVEGTLTATHRFMGLVPVSVTKSLS
ncbi:MAG TPA: LEA type 2 family protein [Candidatus Bathyarchaeia archaeon]